MQIYCLCVIYTNIFYIYKQFLYSCDHAVFLHKYGRIDKERDVFENVRYDTMFLTVFYMIKWILYIFF
jgi:hypothetical protein